MRRLRAILTMTLMILSTCSYASYLAPGGVTYSVQYKNGSTYTGSSNFIFNGTNVGIGSTQPGQAMDVQGTVRMTGMIISNGASTGYVLQSKDTMGDVGWTSLALNAWSTSGNNLYVTNGGNVGIGTTLLTTAGLTIMNGGNMGIGTWVTAAALDIKNGNNVLVENSNVGIGTVFPQDLLVVSNTGNGVFDINATGASNSAGLEFINGAGNPQFQMLYQTNLSQMVLSRYSYSANTPDMVLNGGNIGFGTAVPSGELEVGIRKFDVLSNGNVGIGSIHPGQTLDVQGTIRDFGVVVNGNLGIGTNNLNGSGEGALTIMDGSVGVGTWLPTTVFTELGDSYNSGNVGIGTNQIGSSNEVALSIMNGDVGIGTWAPANALDVAIGNIGINTTKNLVGVGTTAAILTFQSDISSIYAGAFSGQRATSGNLNNTALGYDSQQSASSANNDTSIGTQSDQGITSGSFDTGLGAQGNSPGSGSYDTGIGGSALVEVGNGSDNTALGSSSGYRIGELGTNNATLSTFIGKASGQFYGAQSVAAFYMGQGIDITLAGYFTETNGFSDTNETVIGYNTTGNGSNTFTLGSTNVNTTKTIFAYGDVGIDSTSPGQLLDVQGTLLSSGFVLLGNGAANGRLLVTNGVGLGTWMPPSTLPSGGTVNAASANEVAYFTSANAVSGNSSFIFDGNNVGIGTTTLSNAGLSLTNGFVGIGTWVPNKIFSVSGDSYHNGNVGIGTTLTTTSLLSVMNGNVGIGTWVPSALLEVGRQKVDFFVNGNIGVGTTLPMGGLTLGSNNHLGVTGLSGPSINVCAGATISGNDLAFTITPPVGGLASCSVSFGANFNNMPTCVVLSTAASFAYAVSTSGISTTGTLSNTTPINAICVGHD